MGNVTDSLDKVLVYAQLVREELDRARKQLGGTKDLPSAQRERAYGQVCDARVLVDELDDYARREKEALRDKGSLVLYRDCAHCSDSFLTIPGSGREPLYCSGACRQAAYRARRAVTSSEPADHA